MADRFREIAVRVLGRRGFIAQLGAATVALRALQGCDDPEGPAPGDAGTGGGGSEADADTGLGPGLGGDAADGAPEPDAFDDAASGAGDGSAAGPDAGPDDADSGDAEHPRRTASDGAGDGSPSVLYYDDGSPEQISPITPNDEFYVVLWKGEPADVDLGTWELELRNRGTRVVGIDWELLSQMPSMQREHTLQCIESRPGTERMNNAIWTGLPLPQLLDILGFDPDGAAYLKYSGADGYTTSTPIGDLDKPIWLVWLMNGSPLPAVHGFPARLLVPGRFGWKNMKQLAWIDFVDDVDELAFQESWATAYLVQSLTVSPTHMAVVDDGLTLRILGRAYAGTDPMDWIRLSFDDGESWHDVEFTYAPGGDVWTLWRLDWRPPGPGTYRIRASCRTQGGQETDPAVTEDLDFIPWPGAQMVEITVV